jgi:hypothetical protein
MEAKRSGRREQRADLVFAIEDPYKNIVRLERNTWETHITAKHGDVVGREVDVKNLIASPDVIKGSTKFSDIAFFEGGGLRAIVQYESENFTTGASFAKLNTVYLNDGTKPAFVGGILYTSGTEPKKVKK